MNQRPRHGGFSLLQMVFTIVVLGILAKFAIPKLLPAATMTVQPQAQGMRDVIRRAQSLAMTRGQRMRVTVSAAASSVSVSCASGTPPCPTDASFVAGQGVGVGAGVGGPAAIEFNTLGQPVAVGSPSTTPLAASTTFTISYRNPDGSGCLQYAVTVAPNTGQVSQPGAPTPCP